MSYWINIVSIPIIPDLTGLPLFHGPPSLVPVMLFVHDYPSHELVSQHLMDAPSELLGVRNTKIHVVFVTACITVTIGNSSAFVCTASPPCM